jgi:hypothetical protein
MAAMKSCGAINELNNKMAKANISMAANGAVA